MKKIKVAMLCALVACLLTACDDFCVLTKGAPNKTWTYNNNGQTASGEFTTDQYGAASFDVPEDTDCGKVDLKEKGGSIAPEAPPIN